MAAPSHCDAPQYSERQSEPRYTKMAFGAGHSRRYGTYFGPRATAIEPRVSQDSDGTWEFVTPPSASMLEGTEAQKVAMMYRMGSRYSGNSDSTLASPPPKYSAQGSLAIEIPKNERGAEAWGKQYTPIVGDGNAGVTYDQRGLLAAFQEAMDTANKNQQHFSRGDRIPCPRAGCRDQLANVNCLMYHLHIHDIGAENLVECHRCKSMYEHSDKHRCSAKRSSRRGPIYRALSKFTFFSRA